MVNTSVTVFTTTRDTLSGTAIERPEGVVKLIVVKLGEGVELNL